MVTLRPYGQADFLNAWAKRPGIAKVLRADCDNDVVWLANTLFWTGPCLPVGIPGAPITDEETHVGFPHVFLDFSDLGPEIQSSRRGGFGSQNGCKTP